ncbi:MAG: hypothetical protein O7E52_00835, partial [Candidatus Poribacteria bacterium]|nr:hypothetical protein [Candidatus Poribacteria bacterium]
GFVKLKRSGNPDLSGSLHFSSHHLSNVAVHRDDNTNEKAYNKKPKFPVNPTPEKCSEMTIPDNRIAQ